MLCLRMEVFEIALIMLCFRILDFETVPMMLCLSIEVFDTAVAPAATCANDTSCL